MKKIVILSLGILLIGVGCAVKSNNSPSLSADLSDYQVQITKSEVNQDTLNLKAKNPATMKELLSLPEVKSTKELRAGKETVTMLAGVITTNSREWNLYVNDQKVNYLGLEQITVKPADKIEWKYEAK